jgi:Rrf2 family protein
MVNSDMQVFTAKFLVEKLGMPDKYLRRLMTDMSKKGFIKSLQGREGGYVFAKNANNISLADVIDSVEGMDRYTGCVMGFDKCSDENPCSLHKAYAPLRDKLVEFLTTHTIADLKDSEVSKF